jgi:uncharacterized membrane protein
MLPPYILLRVLLEWTASAGFALLAGGLIGRWFCLRRLLTVREARMVRASDRLLWIGAFVLVLPRLVLVFSDAGLGRWFYLSNPFQIAQALVLCLILVLEIWPAKRFRSWARHLDLDQVPYHTDRDQDRMRRIWWIQIAALLLLPLFDPLVRLGCGLAR